MRGELCLSPPRCLRFLLTQTLLGAKRESRSEERGKKKIGKTDVVSGERRKSRRQRGEDMEVK